MFIIQTFTLSFDKVQDRVSLTARNPDGEVILLWLTQRLLNRLAQALIQWLNDEMQAAVDGNAIQDLHASEHTSGQPLQKPASPARAQDPDSIVNPKILPALHAFEQRAAQAVHKRIKPVQSDEPLHDHLVTSIDLRCMPKGYGLVLKWSEGGAAKMSMDSTQLRQFMGMLYRAVGIAGWPRDRWPAWFASEPSELSEPPGGGVSSPVLRH